jgi:hypothetical protein
VGHAANPAPSLETFKVIPMTTHPHPMTSEQRRSLSRRARDAFPPMGVYAIRDARTGRARVGSSRNVHARLNRIQFELRLGTHADRDLQEAWRHDAERISFEVVELVKERTDAAFDYGEELRLLEELHREQLSSEGQP